MVEVHSKVAGSTPRHNSPFFGIQTTGYRPISYLTDLLLGGINGLDNVLWGFTFASLIFTGALAPYLPLAVALSLTSGAIIVGVIALTSGVSVHIAGTEEQAVAILATVAVLMNTRMGDFASVDSAAATMFAIMAFSALLLGICYILAARFNLGLLIQLMPFPVVCGFLAGTGWLFATAGVSMVTGIDVEVFHIGHILTPDALVRWVPALCCGIGIYVLLKFKDHSLTLPLSLVACAAAFFAFAYWQGNTLDDLRANGWVFTLAAPTHAKGLLSLDFGNVNWGFIGTVLPEIGAIVMISLLTSSFSFSALELGTGTSIELNHELVSHGLANIGSAACLGMPGGIEVPATLMAHDMGASSRLAPFTACALLIVTAFAGQNIIGFVPKIAMGALVFVAATQFIYEYLIQAGRQMKVADIGIVWLIFAVIVVFNFIPGVLVGIVLTSLLFIVRYSKIDILGSSYSLNQIGSSVERANPERMLLQEVGEHVRLFNLRGFLFFGTANVFFERMKIVCDQSPSGTYFIFNFRRVSGIDSTAAQVFLKITNLLAAKKITPIFCALSPEAEKACELAGVFSDDNCLLLSDPDLALKWVEERLLAENETEAKSNSVMAMLEGILGDRDKAEKLASAMEPVSLAKGEYLFRQGNVEASAYLIQSGTIEIQLESEAGKIIHLREFRHGSLVGEMAAYTANKKRSASAVAIKPSVLYRLDASRMKVLNGFDAEAVLHELVARLLTARLGFMNQRIIADL